jgi:hypothetical protein
MVFVGTAETLDIMLAVSSVMSRTGPDSLNLSGDGCNKVDVDQLSESIEL